MEGLGLSSGPVLFTVFEGKTVNLWYSRLPFLRTPSGGLWGDLVSVIAGKKLFCLLTDEIICSYANKVSDVTALNWRMVSLFSFILMSLYTLRVRILDEVLQRKTSEMSRWGAWKCLHFLNSESPWYREFFSAMSSCVSPGPGSCPQWRGVRNSEVSAGRESTVHSTSCIIEHER